MIDRDKLRLALTLIAITALAAYHLTNQLVPTKEPDMFVVMKIAQIIVLGTLAVFFLYSPFLVRLMGGIYIGGTYEGESQEFVFPIAQEDEDVVVPEKPKRTVKFTVRQNLFSVYVNGSSYEVGRLDLISHWRGPAFEISNEHFVFALRLTTTRGECGILTTAFDADQVSGFYNSSEPGATS